MLLFQNNEDREFVCTIVARDLKHYGVYPWTIFYKPFKGYFLTFWFYEPNSIPDPYGPGVEFVDFFGGKHLIDIYDNIDSLISQINEHADKMKKASSNS